MRNAAAERGLTVQMGYMLRYNPAFQLLFRAAREGWLGDITEIDASMGKLLPDPQLEKMRDYPGGGMFELACHLVDAVVTLLGKPAAIHAFTKSTRPNGFPDNQLAVLEYPRATVTLRCNHGDPFGAPHRRFAVTGTKGAMEIQPLESGKGTLRLTEPRGDFAKGETPLALKIPADRYAAEFQDLAAVIQGEKPLAWDAPHDIAVHETALRAAGVK
jgi:predicted dehydrogenase